MYPCPFSPPPSFASPPLPSEKVTIPSNGWSSFSQNSWPQIGGFWERNHVKNPCFQTNGMVDSNYEARWRSLSLSIILVGSHRYGDWQKTMVRVWELIYPPGWPWLHARYAHYAEKLVSHCGYPWWISNTSDEWLQDANSPRNPTPCRHSNPGGWPDPKNAGCKSGGWFLWIRPTSLDFRNFGMFLYTRPGKYGKSQFLMGKSTISMAISIAFCKRWPEGTCPGWHGFDGLFFVGW